MVHKEGNTNSNLDPFLSSNALASELASHHPQFRNCVGEPYAGIESINRNIILNDRLLATVANKVHTANVFIKTELLRQSF